MTKLLEQALLRQISSLVLQIATQADMVWCIAA
jgi:hypothetical protein